MRALLAFAIRLVRSREYSHVPWEVMASIRGDGQPGRWLRMAGTEVGMRVAAVIMEPPNVKDPTRGGATRIAPDTRPAVTEDEVLSREGGPGPEAGPRRPQAIDPNRGTHTAQVYERRDGSHDESDPPPLHAGTQGDGCVSNARRESLFARNAQPMEFLRTPGMGRLGSTSATLRTLVGI